MGLFENAGTLGRSLLAGAAANLLGFLSRLRQEPVCIAAHVA
jgi:hypothetical protein